MEILRTTGLKIGLYAGKITAIVAGIGVTIIVSRPLRRALFARFHGRSRNIYRKEMDGKRRAMFDEIHSLCTGDHTPLNIVELGTAIAENASLYPTNAEITCVTTNVYRNKELYRIAELYPFINVERCSPEVMSVLEDDSVDVVVSMLSMCTCTDIDKALKEIKRILKEGGRYYFLEHVAAKKLSVTSRIQKRYGVFWGMFFYGCNVDRKLSKIMKTSGFQKVTMDKFTADVDVNGERYLGKSLNEVINSAVGYMIGPHVVGVAIK